MKRRALRMFCALTALALLMGGAALAEALAAASDGAVSLPDGVYTPDRFGWSGGSGKVTITCDQVTVKDGAAVAEIQFSSPNYPYVKVDGAQIDGEHTEGASIFQVPVHLNANTPILGMTTAMSQDHEVAYTLFVYIRAAEGEAIEGAPELPGLKYLSSETPEHAKLFALHRYAGDVTAIEVAGVGLTLVAPAEAELPAGMEREIPVVRRGVSAAYVAGEDVAALVKPLNAPVTLAGFEGEDAALTFAGAGTAPDYAALLAGGCDLAILPADYADPRVTGVEDAAAREGLSDEDCAALRDVRARLDMLGIPAFVDRSADEADEAARQEWLQCYAALFE